MVYLIAAILAIAGFALVVRLLSAARLRWTWLLTFACVAFVGGLALLVASGRLHWLAAVAAAVAPFARRSLSLLRFVPFAQAWRRYRNGTGAGGRGTNTGDAGSGSSGGAMTVAQARQLLGVDASAPEREIIAAHRRIIQKVHPDRGGSDYLAAQVNAAKELLIDDLKRRG